jgi:hypothetical protein
MFVYLKTQHFSRCLPNKFLRAPQKAFQMYDLTKNTFQLFIKSKTIFKSKHKHFSKLLTNKPVF